MIRLHRVEGQQLILNADLIESIEETPGTVITLVGGRRLTVLETSTAIAEAVRTFRATVLATAESMRGERAQLISLPVRAD